MRIILLLCLFTFLFLKAPAQQHSYFLERIMGQSLSNPHDFSIAPNGDIYVVDNFSIKVFNNATYAQGIFVREILIDHEFVGHSIALDKEGYFYLVRNDHKVYKYTLQGEYVMSFGGKGQGPGLFDSPKDIALDLEGNIYVADTYNYRIQKFDKQGKLLQIIGGSGTGHGNLNEPTQLKIDSNNKINVIEKHRFLRLMPDGTPDLSINFTGLSDLAIDAEGNIFISYGPLYYINKYASDGHLIETLFSRGKWDGEINTSNIRLNFDEHGYIYLLEIDSSTRNNRLQKLHPGFDFSWILSYGKHYADNATYLDLNRSRVKFNATGNFYTTNESTIDSTLHWVQLFDVNGVWMLSFDIPNDLRDSTIVRDITIGNAGDVYILAQLERGIVHRYSSSGKYISSISQLPPSSGATFSPNRLLFDQSDNMYLTDGRRCLKYSPQGNLISDFKLEFEPDQVTTQNPIPDITLGYDGNLYLIHGSYVEKYDQTGKRLLQFNALAANPLPWEAPAALDLDAAGAIYVADRLTIRKFDKNGKILSTIQGSRSYTGTAIRADLSVSPDGSSIRVALKDDYRFFNTIRIYSSNDLKPTNQISGTIFSDTNGNCEKDLDEQGLEGVLVSATPGPYYTKTDRLGNYKFNLGIGTYTVKQIVPEHGNGRQFKQLCPPEGNNSAIGFDSNNKLSAKIDFANHVTLSPYLSVSVSSDRRRRCFESTTKVRYTNSGFAPAKDAKVHLQLPVEVELLSADKPYTRQPNGTYVFAVGDLAAGRSGTITIQDKVTCGDESVRNRTVCTRAWITPSNNAPAKPTPTITITGQCNYDLGMVRFVVKNTGQADMSDPKLFRKYIDGDLSSIEQYRLAAGDSMVLWVPTSGMTVRLEAEQPDGNGDNTLASVTVEACRVSATQTGFSTGIVNLMPADEEEAEVSEECLLITDSFDPNDKLVTPVGRTAENYTPTNTALKYKIRFQNTGTDVAYRVVVVDTLSEHLDLSTLQVGAASHTHRFEVSGKGLPVLTWTFDNIMLPDSTADEPNSHGYIQFSIKPNADLPEKTAVENFADIFFDFNSPVRTNVTVNRIYDMPPVINEAVRMDMEDILATPGITGFAPAAGRFGIEVVLSGKKFSSIAARNKVYFNNKPAQVVSASATELRVLVPDGAATGSIKVVTSDGATSTTELFQVYQPPVITSFSPAEGIVGQTVTLQGNHLDTDLIESIKLGTLICEIVSNSAGTLVVKVPPNAVTAKFEIVTKGGESLSPSTYVVWHQPAIHSLSKQTEIVGATITISGQNFASDPARNKVYFGKAQAQVLQATPDMLTVKVPAGAASGFVAVETPGGKANSTMFEVIPGPRFTAMSPVKGSVGTEVELTGVHFLTMGQQDEIRFNGEKALVLEASSDRFKVRVPRGATTGKVQITGFGGIAYSTTDFEIEDLAPAEAILVYPNPTSGHFTVSLQHADFDVQAVEVYDVVGKLVHTTKVASPRPEKLEMNVRLSRSGIYTLHFKTDRGMVIKKLTVL